MGGMWVVCPISQSSKQKSLKGGGLVIYYWLTNDLKHHVFIVPLFLRVRDLGGA